jgi:multidrug efflux pump subunit AcrA (membrane-fusion protein)
VIAPGEAILEIVPNAERLLVEARINPSDIDKVTIGQIAEVRFSAFSQRTSEPVDGNVLSVSADGITDEKTGEQYYLAKVGISESYRDKLGGEKLVPGMQAEVYILTGKQTPLDYLFDPIATSLGRAWREN